MPDDDTSYDQGYRDGIKFVVDQLNVAASMIEKPEYHEVEKDDRTITVIKRSGRPHYAAKLRELAAELQRIITQ